MAQWSQCCLIPGRQVQIELSCRLYTVYLAGYTPSGRLTQSVPDQHVTVETRSGSSVAVWSQDMLHRYRLERWWHPSRCYLNVIGLNPSTATEAEDDPTIRRCIDYAREWGYDGLVMTNLYTLRSTDPKALERVFATQGPAYKDALLGAAIGAGRVLAAWGSVRQPYQAKWADDLFVLLAKHDIQPMCLKVTRQGFPAHPLYQKRDVQPIPYAGRYAIGE